MKIKLILFFVGACMAQDEDYPLTEYPLLQDSFADIATLRYLDGYLVSRGVELEKCYEVAKPELDNITITFKSNLTNARSNIPKTVLVEAYQKNARNAVKLLTQICDKLLWCQREVCRSIQHESFMEAAKSLWDCKPKISKLIKQYESELDNITVNNSKMAFKNMMDKIIAEVEEKYKEVNYSFEKCVNGTSSTQ